MAASAVSNPIPITQGVDGSLLPGVSRISSSSPGSSPAPHEPDREAIDREARVEIYNYTFFDKASSTTTADGSGSDNEATIRSTYLSNFKRGGLSL